MPLDISGNIINTNIVSTFTYKNITTRGLILNLDASTNESYSDNNIWFDITGTYTGPSARYWRYVEGSAVASHHPRTARITFVDTTNVSTNIVTYVADNCADLGVYIPGTVSYDFGAGNNKTITKVQIYSSFGGGLRSSNYTIQYSNDNSTWFNHIVGVMSNYSSCGLIDGTITNKPTYSSSNNGALIFDGSNDKMGVNIFPSTTRSFFIWVKYNSATGTGGYQLTGTQQSNAYTYTGRQDSNGKIYTYAGSGGNGGESNYVLSTATWYYQGFTLAANGDVGIYVNGSLIETKTGNGLGGTPTNEFAVGCVNDNHWMNATIPIVHLYNRTLTTAEVLQNYNIQKSRFGL
jgi:hypothetical protein